jgi:NADPH:quinone reductase-like Zn-dependent oxidoreductase
MRAAFFDKAGIENLRVGEFPDPVTTGHDVLVKVHTAGVNPIDYFAISGRHGLKSGPTLVAKPMPHIAGAEIAGTISKLGSHVKHFAEGDRVAIYSRLFDGTCDYCRAGLEMLCRTGGIIGVACNGGFAEYVSVPSENVCKIPDGMSWEEAASMSVTALTPFHALREAHLKAGEWLLVFGASGNTGMVAVQLGKRIGASVIAVSSKGWVRDLGPDHVIEDRNTVVEQVREFTEGKMADVVLNSLGAESWEASYESVAINGRWVTFGILTGAQVSLDLRSLYNKQIKLMGSTGGTMEEFRELVKEVKGLNVRVWKKFGLEQTRDALDALFAKQRDGRVMLVF